MTSDKHMDAARDIAFDFDCDWTADGRRRGEAEELAAIIAIAAALAQAEREGMKRAAEIVRTMPESRIADRFILERAILSNADNQSRQPVPSQADRDAGSDEHLPVATGSNPSEVA